MAGTEQDMFLPYSVRLFRFFMMLAYVNMYGESGNGIATRGGIPVRQFQTMVANIIVWRSMCMGVYSGAYGNEAARTAARPSPGHAA